MMNQKIDFFLLVLNLFFEISNFSFQIFNSLLHLFTPFFLLDTFINEIFKWYVEIIGNFSDFVYLWNIPPIFPISKR